MLTPREEERWDRAAAETRAAIQQWRAAHPQATLKEIEVEVDRRLAGVRARLVEAAAQAGPVGATAPPCPECGEPMWWDGERTRRLTTSQEAEIALSRRSARCPRCGTGLFPPG